VILPPLSPGTVTRARDPNWLGKGNVLSVFFGAQLPFLLRLMGEHYRSLDQSYVHGIMKGEAMEELKAGRLT
jgi:hypothetical protein